MGRRWPGGAGNASRIDWNAGSSETFYIKVGAFEASQTGTYGLSVNETAPPVCQDVTIVTDEDTQGVTEPVCSDVDGDQLSHAIVSQPEHGTASVVV